MDRKSFWEMVECIRDSQMNMDRKSFWKMVEYIRYSQFPDNDKYVLYVLAIDKFKKSEEK